MVVTGRKLASGFIAPSVIGNSWWKSGMMERKGRQDTSDGQQIAVAVVSRRRGWIEDEALQKLLGIVSLG